MGFNLRNWLEESIADINPFDNGATAQTVRANRAKAQPAQTVKKQQIQNRPMFQQNNQPTYQNQQKQFKIQTPSLNFNNSMPKVQTFGQSSDPLKVGQVKTPQIQPLVQEPTAQQAPMMLKPEARQQYAQKQPVNPATLKVQKPSLISQTSKSIGQIGKFANDNLVKPALDVANKSANTVGVPLAGLAGGVAIAQDQAFNRGRNTANLQKAMVDQVNELQRNSFVSNKVASGKANPVEFGKEFTDAGVQVSQFVPAGRVLTGAQKAGGLTAPLVKNILGTNAKMAGVYGTSTVANDALQGREITPVSAATAYAAPFALGAGSEMAGVVGRQAGRAAKNLPDNVAHAQAEKISGLPKVSILNDNEAYTLGDFGDYLGKRAFTDTQNPKTIQAINNLHTQARHAAQNAGIDITSGSARDVQNRIATYLEQRDLYKQGFRAVRQGGYMKVPGSGNGRDINREIQNQIDFLKNKNVRGGVRANAERELAQLRAEQSSITNKVLASKPAEFFFGDKQPVIKAQEQRIAATKGQTPQSSGQTLDNIEPPKTNSPAVNGQNAFQRTPEQQLQEEIRKTIRQSQQRQKGASADLQERGFVNTVINDPNTDAHIKERLTSLYQVRNTKQLQQRAATLVKENPDLAHKVALGNEGDISVAVGSELIKKMQNAGNFEQALQVADTLAKQLTDAGRTAQAASIYGRLTPEGVLRFTQRVLRKYNEDNGLIPARQLKLSSDKAKSLTEQAKAIQTMTEGREKELAIKRMLADVYELVPSSFAKKVSTLQTMAQLMNTKTMVRNIAGNSMFGGLDNVSQVIGAGIDKGVSAIRGSERTVALPNLKTQAIAMKQGGKEAFDEVMRGVNTGPNTQFELGDIPTFRSGLLGKAEKAMGVSLRVPDRAAYRAAFDDTVKGLMKVNKLDKPTQAILEQAHMNGLYKTFQDNSMAAQAFSKIKDGLNSISITGKDGAKWGLGDLLLKYAKTPGNILARGVDYSPIGLTRGLLEIAKPAISHKPFNQHAFSMATARGIVGSGGLMGAGAVLGQLGIITEKPSTDSDLRDMQKASGLGGYQINVDALKRYIFGGFNPQDAKLKEGDNLVSYDWAVPASVPLSAGAAMATGKNAKDGATSTLDNAFSGIDSLVEQPMVSGLSTFFGNVKQKGAVGAMGETLKGAPASFVPSSVNQARQLTDNSKRISGNALDMALNRIPGLSTSLPEQVDGLGHTKENYQNGSNNLFNVLFNPAFTSKYQPSPEAKLALDIFNSTGQANQIPRVMAANQKINGENVKLTPQQQHDFQSYVGKNTELFFKDSMANGKLTNLTDEQKSKYLSKGLENIVAAGKNSVLGNNSKLDKGAKQVLNGQSPTITLKSSSGTSSGTSSSPKEKYETALKDYQTKKKDMSEVQRFKKEKELDTLKVKSDFPQDVVELWGMSKGDIYNLLTKDKDGNRKAEQLIKLDQAMYDAGLTKYLTFKNGIAPAQRGGTKRASTGRRSAGRKGTGSRGGRARSAKGKFDYKLFGFSGSGGTSNSKQLHDLLKRAQLKVQK